MASYGYYQPAYYQSNGLAGYGATSYQVNQPNYYTAPSYSTTSDNNNNNNNNNSNTNEFQYNQPAPVSNNWINTGTNGSQPAYDFSYMTNYAVPSYMFNPYTQEQPQTFTQQSNKSMSQGISQSRTSSQVSQMQMQLPQQQQILSEQQQQNEDLNQLTPQIEAAYEAATGKRRQPVIKRQVITLPGVAGRIQQVVRRLPTPTPDIIERVFIVKPQRDTVNLIIERPATPPVQYKDKTVYGKQRRPLINPKIVTVAPRQLYSQQQQIEQAPIPADQPMMMMMQQPQQQPTRTYESQSFQQDKPKGYLIAPVKYDEQGSPVQAYTQLEGAPTFSQTNTSNVMQPYVPFDQYSQGNTAYMGYPSQYSTPYGVMNY